MSAKSFLIENLIENSLKVWTFKPFTLSEELCLGIQGFERCLRYKRILPTQVDQNHAHFYLVSIEQEQENTPCVSYGKAIRDVLIPGYIPILEMQFPGLS